MIPIPYRWAAFCASLAACYGIGYTQAAHRAEVERAKVEAVAVAESQRRQQVEAEVKDAQAGHLAAWNAQRDLANGWWLRFKTASAGRVPSVCPVSGSTGPDQQDGLEAVGGAGDRDILPALVSALETGERLEATLQLCQSELRQCASIR